MKQAYSSLAGLGTLFKLVGVTVLILGGIIGALAAPHSILLIQGAGKSTEQVIQIVVDVLEEVFEDDAA
jgi:hypothetical protein